MQQETKRIIEAANEKLMRLWSKTLDLERQPSFPSLSEIRKAIDTVQDLLLDAAHNEPTEDKTDVPQPQAPTANASEPKPASQNHEELAEMVKGFGFTPVDLNPLAQAITQLLTPRDPARELADPDAEEERIRNTRMCDDCGNPEDVCECDEDDMDDDETELDAIVEAITKREPAQDFFHEPDNCSACEAQGIPQRQRSSSVESIPSDYATTSPGGDYDEIGAGILVAAIKHINNRPGANLIEQVIAGELGTTEAARRLRKQLEDDFPF